MTASGEKPPGYGGVGPTYPVGLLLSGRRCLLVGGGEVAVRKLVGLVDAGAEVTVVAPRLAEAVVGLAARVERRPYQRGEVAGYWLAVAATGRPEVDREVFADGEAAGVPVNAADDPQACSFVLPAVLRRGAVSVAVASEGTSPALAGWLRDRLAGLLAAELPQLEEMASLAGEARRQLREAGVSTAALAWRPLYDQLAALLASERAAEARQLADGFVRAARGAAPAGPPPP